MRIAVSYLDLSPRPWPAHGTTAAQNSDSPGGQETATKSFAAARMRPEDDKAIRQVVDAFVKDYNNHDAPAIAALFASDGMAADEEGNVARGREAIEQVFAAIFKEHPQTRIENAIESIRMVGPAEAVETGTATIRHDGKRPPKKAAIG